MIQDQPSMQNVFDQEPLLPPSISHSFWRQLAADIAAYKRFFKQDSGLRLLLGNDSLWLLIAVRLRAFAFEKRIPGLSRLIRMGTLIFFGADIDASAQIGTGVVFLHSVGIVIGGSSKVGDLCIFMGSNTLGTNENNGYPSLGRHVKIGAGARILGSIQLGNDAVVGANAVVTKNVPHRVTVVSVNRHLG